MFDEPQHGPSQPLSREGSMRTLVPDGGFASTLAPCNSGQEENMLDHLFLSYRKRLGRCFRPLGTEPQRHMC